MREPEKGAALEGANPTTVASSHRRSLPLLVQIAIWFGLATGLIEVAILALEKRHLYSMMRLSRDFLCMAPIAEVTLLLIITLPLSLVGCLWRKHDLFP